ncbi:DUF983 domain-containing protein [Gellertiella hungarica]|uniref:Uncharacterized protein (DUF983 family) n=1 Tax=Gellertiella hungarica TaxID=1572859 RepID=A0A7W6J5M5_9HYPH|nr:DUF983 domain-containing protein [Gellertiella hungarica]MBB4064442.1 uncharacterized protein (DUF983 family) [Gellertiella hungarica]
MTEDNAHYPPVDPYTTGLLGRCPRCGNGNLFQGMLKVAPRCNACGLDYSFVDAGDGPVVFVMLIVGFVLMGLALWLEFTFSPPVWLHIVLWGPISVGMVIIVQRMVKGLLISLQYKNNAGQGTIDRG